MEARRDNFGAPQEGVFVDVFSSLCPQGTEVESPPLSSRKRPPVKGNPAYRVAELEAELAASRAQSAEIMQHYAQLAVTIMEVRALLPLEPRTVGDAGFALASEIRRAAAARPAAGKAMHCLEQHVVAGLAQRWRDRRVINTTSKDVLQWMSKQVNQL